MKEGSFCLFSSILCTKWRLVEEKYCVGKILHQSESIHRATHFLHGFKASRSYLMLYVADEQKDSTRQVIVVHVYTCWICSAVCYILFAGYEGVFLNQVQDSLTS